MKDFQLDIYSYKGEQNSVSFAAKNIAEFVREAIGGRYLSIAAQKHLDRTWTKASVFDHNVEASEIYPVLPESASGIYIVIPKYGPKVLTIVIADANNVAEALYMAAQQDIPEEADNIEATVFDEDLANFLIKKCLNNNPLDVVLLGSHEVTFAYSDEEPHEIPGVNRIKFKRLKVEDEN